MKEIFLLVQGRIFQVSAPPGSPDSNHIPTLRTQPSGAATTNAVRGQSAQSFL